MVALHRTIRQDFLSKVVAGNGLLRSLPSNLFASRALCCLLLCSQDGKTRADFQKALEQISKVAVKISPLQRNARDVQRYRNRPVVSMTSVLVTNTRKQQTSLTLVALNFLMNKRVDGKFMTSVSRRILAGNGFETNI